MTSITKEKTELIKKVSRLYLSKKEDKLFQKILEKGVNNWNDNDIEFLTLLQNIHYHLPLSIGGLDIYGDRTEQIKIAEDIKRKIALHRLAEEPFSLWLKNIKKYDKQRII
jgi:hypothetical protein